MDVASLVRRSLGCVMQPAGLQLSGILQGCSPHETAGLQLSGDCRVAAIRRLQEPRGVWFHEVGRAMRSSVLGGHVVLDRLRDPRHVGE